MTSDQPLSVAEMVSLREPTPLAYEEPSYALERPSRPLEAVELFTGCGGLAFGLAEAGASHRLLVEFNSHAAATIGFNAQRGVKHVADWSFVRDDVRNIDWSKFRGEVRIVAGGPPCQPFSVGGKARGNDDHRDMWPEAIRAVREISPDLFIFENVRGLLRPAFAQYVQWITRFLERPAIEPGEAETYAEHSARLASARTAEEYRVSVFPVNAADFGAPQIRHRVFFVGVKSTIRPAKLGEPTATHSRDRLVWDKWVTGEYWHRHGIPRPTRPKMTTDERSILKRLKEDMFEPTTGAWRTCRDAFRGLGEPTATDDGRNHKNQPGARSYAGHTGSSLDFPAKALKAGVHGVPGGENMMCLPRGKVRYFTIREAARLQGIPDDYRFPGSWTESMRQLGNAVPTMLAEHIARWAIQRTLHPSADS